MHYTRSEQYLLAFYYTVTTVTTVGYGDISASSSTERILACFSMLIGVLSFSYATGTLSSILTSVDHENAGDLKRLAVLDQIQTDYNIPNDLYQECLAFIKIQTQCSSETASLIQEFPQRLKQKIARRLFKRLKTQIFFFS